MNELVSLENLSILTIDDNAHMRSLLKSLLLALKCRSVAEAADGGAALSLLSGAGGFKADLIICDWDMQPMNGLTFLRKLRLEKSSPAPLTPVLMLTSYTDRHTVCQARDAGINEFLAKPISAKSLSFHIRSTLGKPRPFVRSPAYCGPDRRRRNIALTEPDRRKTKPQFVSIPDPIEL